MKKERKKIKIHSGSYPNVVNCCVYYFLILKIKCLFTMSLKQSNKSQKTSEIDNILVASEEVLQ